MVYKVSYYYNYVLSDQKKANDGSHLNLAHYLQAFLTDSSGDVVFTCKEKNNTIVTI